MQPRVGRFRHEIVPQQFYCTLTATRSEADFAGASWGLTKTYYVIGNNLVHPWNNGSFTDALTPGQINAKATDDPAGFFTLASLYDYCRVYSSSISVQFDPSTAQVQDTILVVSPQSNTEVVTSPSLRQILDLREKPFVKSKVISSQALVPSASQRARTVTHSMSTATIWGVNKRAVSDEDDYSMFTSSGSSPPVNSWYWVIMLCTTDNANPQVTHPEGNIRIRVTYRCRFESPREAGMSS